MSDSTVYPCPVCQIGYCHPGHKTYLRMFNGMLVSVPDMPVWTCDICLHEEFDRESVERLEALLGASETSSETQRANVKMQNTETNDTTTARRAKS